MEKIIKDFFLKYLKYIGAETGKAREKAVGTLLPSGNNLFFLDCGCGDGMITLKRASIIGTNKIYGVEILDSEIKKAKKNKIIVQKSDLNSTIPFESSKFDIITATQVIEHLYDVDKFVLELRRMLKTNGILIISTENLSAWHNVFALILGLQPSTGPFISKNFSVGFHPLNKVHIKDHKNFPYLKEMNGHTRVMAYNSFKKLFEGYGFELIGERTIGYYPFPGYLADFLSRMDRWHALDVILKLRKL